MHVSLIQLVTGIATKPWLSGNIFSNIKKRWKWMIEFCRTFGNRGIIIFWVNSILIKKSINLRLFGLIFLQCWGPLWSTAIFRALSIYREVYATRNKLLKCDFLLCNLLFLHHYTFHISFINVILYNMTESFLICNFRFLICN